MNTNPWLVDSIKAFSFFNCPECTFRTKEDNLFGYHAAKNHPLSTALFDKQTELEQSTIGLSMVEYSPDLYSNKSNDPLEFTETNSNEIPTCQHCEEKFISFSKLKTHYDECHSSLFNSIFEDFDESFENDHANISSEIDEAHEDLDDNFAAEIGNSGINAEFSHTASQTNKNLTNVKIEFENKSQTMIKCNICNNRFSTQSSLKRHVKTIHDEKRPEKKPSKVYDDSENKPNYSNAPGRSKTSELYILDKFCYVKKDISSRTIYLTCNERNNKDNDCPGYAHIDRITNQMSVKKGHNHSPREGKIAKKSKEKIAPLCDICGKVFKSRKGLKSHRNHVHEKLKPFECTICNKIFGHKGKLKVHIRTVHQKLRLHKCTICDKSYKEKVTLTKHEYAVHGDGNSKPYNCNDCDSSFTFNNKLTRHMKNVHNKKNVKDIEN